MIDLESAAAVVKAARLAHEMVTAQIVADPTSPIVDELRRIANQAFDLAAEYERKQP